MLNICILTIFCKSYDEGSEWSNAGDGFFFSLHKHDIIYSAEVLKGAQ